METNTLLLHPGIALDLDLSQPDILLSVKG
jgi:hypothetical protein